MTQEISINKLSIYLIKEEYSDHENILKNLEKLKSIKIDSVGILYFGEYYTYKPSWIEKFFGKRLSEDIDLLNASSKAVLLTEVKINSDKKRIFAIPFGYGWTLLNHGVWEERFGLKVTLNIIDSNNLRKIGKKNMSPILKDTSEQLSKEGVAADFGIDIEQDLVQSITGKTKEERFGKTITGKDLLSVSTKVNLSNIEDFLKSCYEKYESDEYKKEFGWIDQISEIKNPKTIENLENELIKNIRDKQLKKTWMAVPEIVDWVDVSGFTYNSKKERLKDDINLLEFIDSLSEDKKSDISIDIFNKKKIYCFSASSDELKYQWKAYNCLYCEIQDEHKKKTYLLSNGKWYEVEDDFANEVNNDYLKLRNKKSTFNLPIYNHDNERDYNKKVGQDYPDFYCMDGDFILYGGGYSRIEFCDLFTIDKKIIHVKRYGSSAVLNHLFSQGVVSGELFLAEENFRIKVNEELSEPYKIDNPYEKPNPSNYDVIFGVISSSKKELEIPFFSKVSLRNAKRRLETYGYKVYLQKIESIK